MKNKKSSAKRLRFQKDFLNSIKFNLSKFLNYEGLLAVISGLKTIFFHDVNIFLLMKRKELTVPNKIRTFFKENPDADF